MDIFVDLLLGLAKITVVVACDVFAVWTALIILDSFGWMPV